ncbi:MAG: HAMP domain-containing histidine kinase [Candidatus Omnitrophica bacterium]|nr:HAMP domain-containing histidine kinase [Candidatus Omnitrophota bacterium]
MKFNTIRFKISVLYTTILGVFLIVYTSVLYITLYFNLYVAFDERLSDKTQKILNAVDSYLSVLGNDEQSVFFTFRNIIGVGGSYRTQSTLKALEDMWAKNYVTLRLDTDYITFVRNSDEVIVQSANMDKEIQTLFLKELNDIDNHDEEHVSTLRFKNVYLRVLSRRFTVGDDGTFIIQVGTSPERIRQLMKQRLYYRLLPIPIILLVGFFIGNLFAERILRPMRKLTKTAQAITHEDLSARIQTEHADREMQELINAFNSMIERLEKSFKYVADLSSHIAHELKSPLAIMRGEIEIALTERMHNPEDKRVMAIVLDEIKRMLKIIDDLLLLTRLDYRPEILNCMRFDFRAFMAQLYERSKIMALPRKITIVFDNAPAPLTINGEPLHLRRLFLNLIDNAIKFTPHEGTVTIKVSGDNGRAVISVSDTGIGIAEKDLPKIFDKFYRVMTPGVSPEPGSGLGLTIVTVVAAIHKGTVEVRSVLGRGTTFTVTLPCV